MYKPDYEEIWAEIEGVVRAYIISSIHGADADDLICDMLYHIWVSCESGKKFKEKQHACAYYIRMTKSRTIDFIRRNRRLTELKLIHGDMENTVGPDVFITMHISELVEMAYSMHGVAGRMAMTMYIEGYGYREIGLKCGIGSMTAFRWVSQVIHEVHDERGSVEWREEWEESTMVVKKKKMVKKVVKGYVAHIDENHKDRVLIELDGQLVAVGQLNAKGVLSKCTLKQQGLDKESIVQSVLVLMKNRAQTNKEEDMPTKKKVTKKKVVAKKKAPAKKAPVKKDTSTLPQRKAIDLTAVKDLPRTIAEWQKKCGGEGYCLGGSGMPVSRRFRPGFDAKLKSCMRRLSTPNAKALAKEFGWDSKIAWQD